MDQRAFRDTMGCFVTGVTVVSAKTATGRPVGVTVSAFCSVSLDPPLILICLDEKTADLEAYVSGAGFNVHVLAADQQHLSDRFAGRSGDKFADLDVDVGANGCPVLAGTAALIECVVEASHAAGDHMIVVGRVTRLEHDQNRAPLLYRNGAYTSLADNGG